MSARKHDVLFSFCYNDMYEFEPQSQPEPNLPAALWETLIVGSAIVHTYQKRHGEEKLVKRQMTRRKNMEHTEHYVLWIILSFVRDDYFITTLLFYLD